VPLPLDGVRVMVTRAVSHSGELVDLLEGRGAIVDVVPLIHIGPPPDEAALQNAVDAGDEYPWIVFTSVNGVEAFAQRLKRPLGVNPHIAAVGPATSQAVASLLGRPAHVVPPRFVAEAIADSLADVASAGSQVLVVQAQDARPVLAARLRAAGFDVTAVTAYSTVAQSPADLERRIAAVDVIALASASAVRSLVTGLKREAAPEKLRGKLLACIGPVTETEAHRFGLHVELTPKRSTVDGMVEALCRYYNGAGPSATA
jgi:uroporphyrinogen III methyltransferase/synthase